MCDADIDVIEQNPPTPPVKAHQFAAGAGDDNYSQSKTTEPMQQTNGQELEGT